MIVAPRVRAPLALLTHDPGLVRLQAALRVAVATLLTGIGTLAWATYHHHPFTYAALALLFAMIAPLFVRDARPAQRRLTLVACLATLCASFATARLLQPWAGAADAGFVAIVFTGLLVQGYGPRALGCAMLAVVAYYVGLFLHPGPAEATRMALAALLAAGIVGLVVDVLVPVRHARTLRLAVETVALRATAAWAACERAARGARGHRFASRHTDALNEAALVLEEQTALLGIDAAQADTMRASLVEIEIAAARGASGSDPHDTARRLAAAVAHLRAAAHHAAHHAARHATPHTAPHAARPRRVWAGLNARWRTLATRLMWRPAIRAASAAALAMLIGQSLSPERWFWAVITTFVVFLGARSRADTLHRGAQRIIGTLAGALASVLLHHACHGHPALAAAAMLICVTGWAYTILNAYASGVFFITILVGLVYGQLGYDIGTLVEMRLQEVLAGCAVSFCVALVVLPLPARRLVDERLAAATAALRAAAALTRHSSPAERHAALRALDRRWHELRGALRPLRQVWLFVDRPGLEAVTAALAAGRHAVREQLHTDDPDARATVALALRQLAERLAALDGRHRWCPWAAFGQGRAWRA